MAGTMVQVHSCTCCLDFRNRTAANDRPDIIKNMSPKSGKTNRRALVSLVFSLTSAVLAIGTWVSDGNLNVSAPLAIFLSIAGALVGRKAMRQIKETGEPGRGIALVGVIIGWVLTAVVALFIVFFLAVAASWLLTPGW